MSMGTKTEIRNEKVSVGWRWVTLKNKREGYHFYLSLHVFSFCYKAESVTKSFFFLLVEYKLILVVSSFKVIALNDILKYISTNN